MKTVAARYAGSARSGRLWVGDKIMSEPDITEYSDAYYWERLPDAPVTRERPDKKHGDIILQFTEIDGVETIKGVAYPLRYTMEQVRAMAVKHEAELLAGDCPACGETQEPDVKYRDFFPLVERPSLIGRARKAVRSRLTGGLGSGLGRRRLFMDRDK